MGERNGRKRGFAAGSCLGDARGSEEGAMVEKMTEADGEDEVAEQGVVNAGEGERAGVPVGEGK